MSQHKRQLRERVLHRQSELLASREILATEAPGSDRLLAVDAALAALEQNMGEDWDQVTDAHAAVLNKWLESSETLVEPGSSANAAMIYRRLETRVRLDEIGLPSPAPSDEIAETIATNNEAA